MQKNLRISLICLCLGLCAPGLAYAESTAEKLKKLEQALASEKKDNAKYKTAQKEAEQLLQELQTKLLRQTKILRTTEQELLSVQEKQAETQQSVTTMEQQLSKQHQKLADLLMAAQRLQRVPPEAMLLRPGEPIDAARTNLLLQRTTPDIAAQAQSIKDDLAKLAALKEELAGQSDKLAILQKKQRKQQTALNSDIKNRQALADASASQAKKSQAEINRMNKEAASLRSILADLARRPAPVTRSTKAVAEKPGKTGWGKSVMSFFRGRGPSQLPITGKIRTFYGEKLASGANSQGLSISGTPGGVVVAPEKGVVRFAGPFRQYRLLVIIEHAGGYHSLLGGLHDVYAKVGSSVSAGEPVGKLESDAAHANLYYEVRRNGKPVDPRGALHS